MQFSLRAAEFMTLQKEGGGDLPQSVACNCCKRGRGEAAHGWGMGASEMGREGEPRVACKSFKYLYLAHIWRLWQCVSCNFFARHTHTHHTSLFLFLPFLLLHACETCEKKATTKWQNSKRNYCCRFCCRCPIIINVKIIVFPAAQEPPPSTSTTPVENTMPPFFDSSCECHLNVLRVDLHSLGSIQSVFVPVFSEFRFRFRFIDAMIWRLVAIVFHSQKFTAQLLQNDVYSHSRLNTVLLLHLLKN